MIRKLHKFLLLIVAAAILFSAGSASAAARPRQGAEILLDTYVRNSAKLQKNNFGIPIFMESHEKDDKVHVDVYGIFEHPFSSVVNVLKVPANWCDILSLYPNIKACTFRDQPGNGLLTLYLGRKVYQLPEDARQIIFHYRNTGLQQGYLDTVLDADAGPFGTKNHRLRVEAVPIDGGKTFVHVSYAYSDSVALRLAGKIYFATLGRGKVGFTETGTDRSGAPVYIGGPRGALERNAVRCYFAIQAFMNSLDYPEENRFSMRLNTWYDLTIRYRRQLFDLDRKDYLTIKTAEHGNQLSLQLRIGTAPL